MKTQRKKQKKQKNHKLKKEKTKLEEMKAQRKKQKKQLEIMETDLPRIQADNEKALRDIHELQQRINNHKTSCSADIIEKMQGIESIDQEIVKQFSKKKQLKDALSKLKDDIVALKASTTQEISTYENSKNDIEVATIIKEKKFAKISRKSRNVEANIEKTKLEILTKEIDNEILESGAAIVEDYKKRENDYREKTFHSPYDFGNESECSE